MTDRLALSSAAAAALKKKEIPQSLQCRALIDTGASRTTIRTGIASQLGLNVVGNVPVLTANAGGRPNIYPVLMEIPGGLTVDPVKAVELPMQRQSLEVIIGRDILASSVLVYNGIDGHFTLALQKDA